VEVELHSFLTLSNPIFLPTTCSPALICLGRERGWWITCNYPTVLKEKNIEKQKDTTCTICWLKSVLHEEKCRTGSDSEQTNATKTVSDVFQHRSGTGKSYCRTRFDVGLERVKRIGAILLHPSLRLRDLDKDVFTSFFLTF
jgi:hypothetical protein